MKTRIFNMLALTVLAFVVIFINSSKKAKAAEKNLVVTELSHIKKINKIVLQGNVKVYLSQEKAENVKVYDEYYPKSALVQWEDGELRITSFEKEPLIVEISVSNLTKIEAGGTSSLRAMNKISSVSLDIDLSDQAHADIDVQAYKVGSVLQHNAKLSLKGEAEFSYLALSGNAQYSEPGFFASNKSTNICKGAIASINQDANSIYIKASTRATENSVLSITEPEF